MRCRFHKLYLRYNRIVALFLEAINFPFSKILFGGSIHFHSTFSTISNVAIKLKSFLNKAMYSFKVGILLFSSCAHYSNLYTEKQVDSKLAIQKIYSPCCGWCGQRVISDNLKDEQTSLFINCKMEEKNSRYCTGMRIGTQKHVDLYKNNTIIQHSVYRPVYDSTALKKLYPNIDREAYFDSILLTSAVIPLTTSDAAIIQKAIDFTGDGSCNKDHLKLIYGFVLVRSEMVKNKKKDF